ncbi:hypothetical protein B0T20DRAFT_495736 [Sordaria brevicollis]|uniref:Uncharacterized protein n=1 Tax=Sordaria brevicollis TaxID=83679 RepID=A0AAE0UD22_SORBR|nr:hypothetical protein B0T20DRAFT_495736 [Sordaria brevicollis]
MSLSHPNRLAGDFREQRGHGPTLIDEPRHQQPIRPFPLWLAGGRRSSDGARLETALPPESLDCSPFLPPPTPRASCRMPARPRIGTGRGLVFLPPFRRRPGLFPSLFPFFISVPFPFSILLSRVSRLSRFHSLRNTLSTTTTAPRQPARRRDPSCQFNQNQRQLLVGLPSSFSDTPRIICRWNSQHDQSSA